ncbi:MAG: hypothetical protein J0L64_28915, partial [Acidobacteria bacterium]|nr:hypothetical protein [Acidobacteriota bacterium]
MSTQKKPPSEAKLRANRANALKSTGPRTLEGKRTAARNAITHALTARDLTALGEAYEALPATVQHFTDAWNPRTAFEQSLVIQLATLCLRLNRCARMETGLFDMSIPMIDPQDSPEVVNAAIAAAFSYHEKSFTCLSRYEANLSRAYERTFKELLATQKLDPAASDTTGPDTTGPDTPPEELFDETNPTGVENTGPQLLKEAKPSRRLELESGPEAPETGQRRSGHQINMRKPKPQTVELLWVNDDDDPDAPPTTSPA